MNDPRLEAPSWWFRGLPLIALPLRLLSTGCLRGRAAERSTMFATFMSHRAA